MAAQNGIEGERPVRLGEEPLGAGLTTEAATQGHGGEVVRGEVRGPAQPGEQPLAQALGPVLEERGVDVARSHQVHRAAAEVANVVWQGKGGELGDGVGRARGHSPYEDAAFEAVRQCRGDAVRFDDGHQCGDRELVTEEGKTSSSERG